MNWLRPVALFGLGAIATVGWSPVGWPIVALAAFVALFLAVTQIDSQRAALASALSFSLGFHVAGHGWAYRALLEHTLAGSALAVMGAAIFIAYLSLFTVLPCWAFLVIRRLAMLGQPRPTPLSTSGWGDTLLLASLLTLGEYGRGSFFNGFNSLSTGYLFSSDPMRGWLPLIGVYGCALLFYIVAGGLATAFDGQRGQAFLHTRALKPLGLLGLLLTVGGWLDHRSWTQPDGPGLSFRLIQGGVPQGEKFNSDQQARQIDHYVRAIVAAPAQLIVTPETALPLDINQLPLKTISELLTFSRDSGSHLFIGVGSSDQSGKGFNSVYHVSPDSLALARYDKRLLMPFGEYAPKGFGWFTGQLSLAWSDLSPGGIDQPAFVVTHPHGQLLAGTLICQEELSGREGRRWLPSAGIFLNPSNLAWFQDSVAIDQRIQIAQVRAIESGRPILRSTNTGVTAHIDHKGRIVAQLSGAVPDVLRGVVQPHKGSTPYARFGEIIAGVLVVAALGVGVMSSLLRRGQLVR